MLDAITRDRQQAGNTESAEVFVVDRIQETLVVTPGRDLRSLSDAEFTAEVNVVLDAIDSGATAVVVDLVDTRSFSSDRLLGPLVVFWNRIRKRNGKLVLCNLCAHGCDVLARTNLDRLWPRCDSRDEALELVRR